MTSLRLIITSLFVFNLFSNVKAQFTKVKEWDERGKLIFFTDINGDGNDDAVFFSDITKNFTVIFCDEEGNQTGLKTTDFDLELIDLTLYHQADIDNDGDKDGVVSIEIIQDGRTFRTAAILFNTGFGLDLKRIVPDQKEIASGFQHCKDLDLDGDLDLILKRNSKNITYENFSGTFVAKDTLPSMVGSNRFFLDHNKDGFIDIATLYENSLHIYENLGDLHFSERISKVISIDIPNNLPKPEPFSEYNIENVSSFDANADGKLDLFMDFRIDDFPNDIFAGKIFYQGEDFNFDIDLLVFNTTYGSIGNFDFLKYGKSRKNQYVRKFDFAKPLCYYTFYDDTVIVDTLDRSEDFGYDVRLLTQNDERKVLMQYLGSMADYFFLDNEVMFQFESPETKFIGYKDFIIKNSSPSEIKVFWNPISNELLSRISIPPNYEYLHSDPSSPTYRDQSITLKNDRDQCLLMRTYIEPTKTKFFKSTCKNVRNLNFEKVEPLIEFDEYFYDLKVLNEKEKNASLLVRGDGKTAFLNLNEEGLKLTDTISTHLYNHFQWDLNKDSKTNIIGLKKESLGLGLYNLYLNIFSLEGDHFELVQEEKIGENIRSIETNSYGLFPFKDKETGRYDVISFFERNGIVRYKLNSDLSLNSKDTLVHEVEYRDVNFVAVEDLNNDEHPDFVICGRDLGHYINDGLDNFEYYIDDYDAFGLSENSYLEKLDGINYFVTSDGVTTNLYAGTFNKEKQIISGLTYHDENENGNYDLGESPIQGLWATVNYSSIMSNEEGEYFGRSIIGNNIVKSKSTDNWEVTTSLPYEFVLDESDLISHDNHIGFKYVGDEKITITPTISFPRCNTEVIYYLNILNTSSEATDANELIIELNNNLEFITVDDFSYSEEPGKIRVTIPTIETNGELMVKLRLKLPDFSFMDTPLPSTFFMTNNGITSSTTDTINIRCAYDPNDKQINKDTLIDVDEELIYTIRFQNTGTDTAINVVIKDQLSENLDLESFTFLGASDSSELKLAANGELIFTFNKIMLPDSNVNEPESHGFVKYAIKPRSSLFPGNQIKNTAEIYFDYNPAIITNTTINKIKCQEAEYNIQARLINDEFVAAPGKSYQWFSNGDLMLDETGQKITPEEGIKYKPEFDSY